ncbi:MAG: site-specific DNA-methyltransferase, partial [Campylobacterales bacterium]
MKKNTIEEQSINDNNYKKLKELFPHAVSVDEDGKYVIDHQKLQMSLDPSKAEIREDGYGLNWVGKKEAYHSAFSKNYKVLKPLKDDSKKWDETENILIKGDNLDALKILRHNYFECIKMIYIDPPYNTKNDGFVYNDNFTTSTEQTLEELGYDKEYIDYIENIQGAKTHSGWLSFMYPRLLLARDLLKSDGVIFISIDDNEVAQLRLLCDEVFGEHNFIGNIIWEKRYGRSNNAKLMTNSTEHILFYRKSEAIEILKESRSEEHQDNYSNPDNDHRGVWTSVSFVNQVTREARPNLSYPIKNPNTNELIEHPTNAWKVSRDKYELLQEENRLYWGADGKAKYPRIKRFLSELDDGMVPINLWKFKEAGTADMGTKEIKTLMGINAFSFPKPSLLIIKMLSLFNPKDLETNKEDIILDFFAGSGTTAHAVMKLNREDGGNRKYICVQWAE